MSSNAAEPASSSNLALSMQQMHVSEPPGSPFGPDRGFGSEEALAAVRTYIYDFSSTCMFNHSSRST